jgi:hypothetical protein
MNIAQFLTFLGIISVLTITLHGTLAWLYQQAISTTRAGNGGRDCADCAFGIKLATAQR